VVKVFTQVLHTFQVPAKVMMAALIKPPILTVKVAAAVAVALVARPQDQLVAMEE
jgi:hypothetical protein